MTAVGLGRSTPFGSLQVGGAIAAGSQHPPSRLIWIPVGPKCLGTDRAHLARGLPRHPRRPRLPGCPLLDDRASLIQETLAHGPGDRRRRRGAGLALRPDSKVRSLRRDGGPRGRRLWCPQPRRDRGQHESRRPDVVHQFGSCPSPSEAPSAAHLPRSGQRVSLWRRGWPRRIP